MNTTTIRSAVGMTRSSSSLLAIAVVVVSTSAVLEIGIINVSYAQVTPSQNPMCDPTDKFINTTESKVCGLPKTPMAPVGPTTTPPQ
jgi:hypothetical protein